MAEPTTLSELHAALARAGFARPVDAARHLQSVALGPKGMERVAAAASDAPDPDLAVAQICRLIAMTGRVPSAAMLQRLAAVLGLSTSLGAFLARHPDAAEMLREDALAAPKDIKTLRTRARKLVASSDDPLTALRMFKRRELLRIAARDLAAGAPVAEVAAELAALAEATLQGALDLLLSQNTPPSGARFTVIGMGKLGAGELNYASDIDVVFVYDAPDESEAAAWANRLAEGLIKHLAATTEEGQAFRVDAGLRPEGRDGALARSLTAFHAYWERWAKPWEFQALIKARPVAGDDALGEEFMAAAAGVVYPERLAPEAIREIRAMKARAERVIAQRGLGNREIKRAPGGIRDIEFAVQLLQLVHGRRDASLRGGGTLPGLTALSRGAYVGDDDADELAAAYVFLRRVEHRLQLAQERQTHTVPEDEAHRRTLARSMGFRDSGTETALEAFDTSWREIQAVVRRIHEKLFYRPLLERFAQAPALAPDAAQERLEALGFRSPGRALKFLGDLTAGLSRRSQLMRTLLPVMLDWMSDSPDPDLAVSNFRDVALALGGNPAALAALRDSPPVVELLCRVLGTSRLLAEHLLHTPELVPALVEKHAFARKSREKLMQEATEHVEWRGDPDARDAAVRRFKRREMLRIACRDLAGGVSPEDVGRELSHLAEAALEAALGSLHEEHPPPPGARFAVVGMGKLGGEELNYASDIDVMFVYDAPDEKAAHKWATMLAEGLLQRLAATTEEGQAFPVDAQLRPEGKDGPLARSLTAYRAYYERWAKTWEFQALVKARPVAGDPMLGQQFLDLTRPFVYPERLDPEKVREIRSMKARIERERLGPRQDPKTQLKVGRGGTIDVEFTVQLLQLMHGAHHPTVRVQGTVLAIAAAAERQLLTIEQAKWLLEAYRFVNRTRNTLYLIRGRAVDALPAKPEESEVLARALGYPGPGARVAFTEDYRRVTRRARQVCEDVFYGKRASR
ncbi:MAG TPA: bifunctional [glutamine synthetase] adenylyltransferase/[glutamine synthetase]-adenylyl-L-tyrosine phosphorylase [Actinomycetota bacterium]